MNDFDESDIIINKLDGLYFNELDNLDSEDDFPKSLIITGVPEVVYDDNNARVTLRSFWQIHSNNSENFVLYSLLFHSIPGYV